MINLRHYEQWLTESTSGEIFKPKRNFPVKFDPHKNKELAPEIFDLITTAYAEIGGHSKIHKPEDIFSDPDWDFWEGIDIHGTNDFDIIIFGQHTNYGVKYSGVGHDGTSDAKRAYLEMRGKELHKLGYYIEVSGKLAEILIRKYRVPVVNNSEEVSKVLGKPIKWLGEVPGSSGDGWYERTLGGHPHIKILVGRPNI